MFWRGATLLCITHDVGETLSFGRVRRRGGRACGRRRPPGGARIGLGLALRRAARSPRRRCARGCGRARGRPQRLQGQRLSDETSFRYRRFKTGFGQRPGPAASRGARSGARGGGLAPAMSGEAGSPPLAVARGRGRSARPVDRVGGALAAGARSRAEAAALHRCRASSRATRKPDARARPRRGRTEIPRHTLGGERSRSRSAPDLSVRRVRSGELPRRCVARRRSRWPKRSDGCSKR